MLRLTRPTLIALMGYPGAGKSTLARWLAGRSAGLQIVSRDTIRAAMFDPCSYSDAEEQAAFEATALAVSAVIQRGQSAIADGMCFYDVGTLEVLRGIAAANRVLFWPVYCSIRLETAITRVEEDHRMRRHPVAHRNGELVRKIAAEFRTLPPDGMLIDMEEGAEKAGNQLVSLLKERMEAR
ncbi:MAG TPA: AAA family ATPase [Allosphingosinicella sp.]